MSWIFEEWYLTYSEKFLKPFCFYIFQELPQEAKRFSRIDKGWTKMMKKAFDTRNVLQVGII